MVQQASVLTDYFKVRAEQTAGAPAYYSKLGRVWEPISWGDFFSQAKKITSGLGAVELKHGDVIGILAPTGLQWELAQVATLLSGGTVVGLDAHDLPERLGQIIQVSNVRGLFVENAKTLERIPTEIWPQIEFAICLSDEESLAKAPNNYRGKWLAFQDVLACDLPNENEASSGQQISPDTVATIIFTSGSTGQPKGIPYTHRQVCLAISDILQAFPEIQSGDRLVCWLPLSNLFQRMINYCAAGRGAETYFVSDPRTIISMLPEIKPHLFISVPRFFEKLYDGIEGQIAENSGLKRSIAIWALDTGQRAATAKREGRPVGFLDSYRYKLADWLVLRKLREVMGGEIKFLVSGSAPISHWLLERFHGMGLLILEAYGLSENVTPIAINRVSDFRFGSVGLPMPSNRVDIAEDGEVLVRGNGVFGGYLGAPDSEAGLNADGYLHTGDLGEFDDEGYLRLVGRKSEIFKTSTGRKVAPVPIEGKLKRIQDVDYAVLIGAGKKMTVAIIAPSMEIEKALSDDKAFSDFADRVSENILPVLEDEQEYAKPLGAVILNRTFSIDTEELTSNLKLRRKLIESKHEAALGALYEALDSGETTVKRFDKNTILRKL